MTNLIDHNDLHSRCRDASWYRPPLSMPFETLVALVIFAAVTSVTPGPNNAMVLASGVHFGFRRTIPHMAGIALGYGVMLAIIGAGVGTAMSVSPLVEVGMRLASGAWMVWVAWSLARSTDAGRDAARIRPMTFLEGALFQWVNPKGWVLAISSMSLFTKSGDLVTDIAIVVAVYVVTCLPSSSIWTAFGVSLRRFLEVPWRLRAFNISMAILLLASTLPLIFEPV
ncbi:MAG: LysE family translocator [Chloroflexi bacterium]|nr:LysE family translocator [Chloroflexota bacterium]